MGMGVRKASSPNVRKGSTGSSKGPVFETVRSPKGDMFSMMNRGSFNSAAGKADKVLEKIVSSYSGRDVARKR